MALGILLMDVSSWVNLELITLNVSLLRAAEEIPYPVKGSIKKQDNHTIIDNAMDELRIIESKKLSAVNHEAPGLLESDYDENYLYQVENMSLDETKEKLE